MSDSAWAWKYRVYGQRECPVRKRAPSGVYPRAGKRQNGYIFGRFDWLKKRIVPTQFSDRDVIEKKYFFVTCYPYKKCMNKTVPGCQFSSQRDYFQPIITLKRYCVVIFTVLFPENFVTRGIESPDIKKCRAKNSLSEKCTSTLWILANIFAKMFTVRSHTLYFLDT